MYNNSNNKLLNYIDEEISSSVCLGFITIDGITKIYPFQKEDLNLIYNIDRFPDRERRQPKILNKYNFFGNLYIVIGYKFLKDINFKRGYPSIISQRLSIMIFISEEVIKTKISQLKKFVKTGNKECSYGLINMYLKFKNVPYQELLKIANTSYKTLNDKQLAFEDLLKIFPADKSVSY